MLTISSSVVYICMINFLVITVGKINPSANRLGPRYNITTIDYLTRRVEEKLDRDYIKETTTPFLFENVVTRFGCPRVLMSDQGTHFLNRTIATLTEEFQIHHQKRT